MTVTILETILAPDGTDYAVLLTDGTRHVFHAAVEQEDPQAFCDQAEEAMLAHTKPGCAVASSTRRP